MVEKGSGSGEESLQPAGQGLQEEGTKAALVDRKGGEKNRISLNYKQEHRGHKPSPVKTHIAQRLDGLMVKTVIIFHISLHL